MQHFKVTVNGKVYEVSVEEVAAGNMGVTSAASVAPVAQAGPAPTPAPAQSAAAELGAGEQAVPAPLGGTIMQINVKTGDRVSKGQVLLTLEALKMENEIVAPHDGTVGQIFVKPKDAVNTGDALLSLSV
ncbi:MAG TPA: acetyl-CoA carboxylase biotin carboxyl carrier protein subunit [Firmicutes bacterium]|jgi:glutaconyl-CoA decarboxylase|nr:acetyl-CoA carboxylase biotin carboxyl carrier protein subunit [Bacillota bacterium]